MTKSTAKTIIQAAHLYTAYGRISNSGQNTADGLPRLLCKQHTISLHRKDWPFRTKYWADGQSRLCKCRTCQYVAEVYVVTKLVQPCMDCIVPNANTLSESCHQQPSEIWASEVWTPEVSASVSISVPSLHVCPTCT